MPCLPTIEYRPNDDARAVLSKAVRGHPVLAHGRYTWLQLYHVFERLHERTDYTFLTKQVRPWQRLVLTLRTTELAGHDARQKTPATSCTPSP
jgi:hypothetical protein